MKYPKCPVCGKNHNPKKYHTEEEIKEAMERMDNENKSMDINDNIFPDMDNKNNNNISTNMENSANDREREEMGESEEIPPSPSEIEIFDTVEENESEDKNNILESNEDNTFIESSIKNTHRGRPKGAKNKRKKYKKGGYIIGATHELNIMGLKAIYNYFGYGEDFYVDDDEKAELERAYLDAGIAVETDNPYYYIAYFNVKQLFPLFVAHIDKIIPKIKEWIEGTKNKFFKKEKKEKNKNANDDNR